MRNTLKNRSWIFGLTILAVVGCSKEKGGNPDPGNQDGTDRYFIAAVVDGATYTMAVNDLEKDTVITTSQAIENRSTFTHYAYNGTNAVLTVNYQQGNPSPGIIFQLDANGILKKKDEFVLQSGFNTVGNFDKYLATAANGKTLAGANAGKTGSVFYLVDLKNENNIAEKTIVTENFVGNKTADFIGIADAGDGEFFAGLVLSAKAVAEGQPANAAPSQDSVFVAKLDANLNVKKIYDDNRLSYSGGQMRSARYGQIDNDDEGNTYVFSGAYSATTTKKAGALLIKKGVNNFDANYHFDIENASGGYRFRKVWHVTEDYFLLEFYNDQGAPGSSAAATQYGIVRMSTKDFKWIRTGFPAVDAIDAAGWPFTANGKAYIPITPSNAQPAVYVVDPKTAIAKKGITVSGVTSIAGLAKLSPQK